MTTPAPTPEPLKCHGGCGLEYGSPFWADLVIPDEAWARIAPKPNGGGVLCANCMVRRSAEEGVECEARFTSGPFSPRSSVEEQEPSKLTVAGSSPAGETIDALRTENAELRAAAAGAEAFLRERAKLYGRRGRNESKVYGYTAIADRIRDALAELREQNG